MKKVILPSVALVLLTLGSARSQDQWNLGSTPAERAEVAKKLRCGNPPEEPASPISVVQMLVPPFDWKSIRDHRGANEVARIIPEHELVHPAPATPAQRSAKEGEWIEKYATKVYSSLTMDCFIAALTDVAFDAKALSEELTKRFNTAEAKTKTITNENYVALLARLEEAERRVEALTKTVERQ